MKKSIFTLVLVFTIAYFGLAQLPSIIVTNNDTTFVVHTISDGISAATDGDTIYIPGGVFNGFSFNKELHIIGVGHHPDSTSATYRTEIYGTVYVYVGAEGSTITGLMLPNHSITFPQSSGLVVSDILVERCNVRGISVASQVTGLVIRECIIRNELQGGWMKNAMISNNVINYLAHFDGALISNNVIMSYARTKTCLFQNNYIKNEGYPWDITYCQFNKNVFGYTPNLSTSTNVQPCDTCNFFNFDLDTTFVNVAGIAFDYSYDYHLRDDSVGKNAGSDGTDIGIYGSSQPWKDGSLPRNPHIRAISLTPITDENGNLIIEAEVQGQGY